MQDQSSQSFHLLSPEIQKWIWKQGWKSLRDIQESAISPILDKTCDIIISAATAGGKTEAAFLPIFSDAKVQETINGIHTLAIIPLKALINDQYRRLRDLGKITGVKVTPWHGDIAQGVKHKLLAKPQGVLLITPESLESILINHASQYASLLFRNLSYIVIDELHAFIGTERGKQLQSLMNRVGRYTQKEPVRIGLSATLGDFNLAFKFLCSIDKPHKLIKSDNYQHDLLLQVKGYKQTNKKFNSLLTEDEKKENSNDAFEKIADHIYTELRGKTNLVFANSRDCVEEFSNMLRKRSELNNIPNEFYPHHGSLAKELRYSLESRMHKGNLPTTVLCTTTLELGIDIGSVDSVVQIGRPPSVSSLRQRLGRSGRQIDTASILRAYSIEDEITDKSRIDDQLRIKFFITIASIELLLKKWYEPPEVSFLHLSTLIQQILSLIAQYGGIYPERAWEFLCNKGAFDNVSIELFQKLLHQLGQKNIIQQDHDGTLVLGLKGEKIVNHYSFYAAFATPEEFLLQYHGKTIGSLPILEPLKKNHRIMFAGREWKVVSTDTTRKIISLEISKGGNPEFSGEANRFIHDKVAKQAQLLYSSSTPPCYLDADALKLFREGQEFYGELEISLKNIIIIGEFIYIFPWHGSKTCNTLALELQALGILACSEGVFVKCKAERNEFIETVKKRIQLGESNAQQLASLVEPKWQNKYDLLLSEELLCYDYASRNIDTKAALAFWHDLSDSFSNRITS